MTAPRASASFDATPGALDEVKARAYAAIDARLRDRLMNLRASFSAALCAPPSMVRRQIHATCRECLVMLVPFAWSLPHSLSTPLARYAARPKARGRADKLMLAITLAPIKAPSWVDGARKAKVARSDDAAAACSIAGCEETGVYVASWKRADRKYQRRTRARYCDTHAEAFARAAGLPWPPS